MDQDNNTDKPTGQPPRRRRTTKKGIIITALIVIAVIGISFIVYFVP